MSGGSDSKEFPCNAGELDLIPGLRRSPGEEKSPSTLVFLPGEFHGQRSLAGYSPQGRKKSDITEATQHVRTYTKRYTMNHVHIQVNLILNHLLVLCKHKFEDLIPLL